MRIVPSCPLGLLGPSEGQPVLCTWRWYHSATGLGLWIVLILSMALPRANRTPRTLLVLAPLAAVLLGWYVFREAMGGNEPDNIVFGIMIQSLAIELAALWLLAHRLAAGAWYKTLLAALGVALGVAIVSGLSLGVQSREMVVAMVFIGVMMVAVIVGYALAARGYGARRAWRFLMFQAAGTIATSFVGMFLILLILTLILDGGPDSAGEFLVAVAFVGLIPGVIVFLIALPFTIMGLSSPFFRQRLILCLPPRTASDPARDTGPANSA